LTTGGGNVGLGPLNGTSMTEGTGNVLLGASTGNGLTTEDYNVMIGANSGSNTQGSSNTFVGHWAGLNKYGDFNIAIGESANSGTLGGASTGNHNIAIGYRSNYLVSTANNAIAIGTFALTALTSGSDNVAIGENSGASLLVGVRNVFVGSNSGRYETGSDKLFIDNQSRTNEATSRLSSLVYGEFDSNPYDQRLTVNGALRCHNFTAAEIASMTPLDGDIVYSTDTDATITSIGFWGRENGSWVKL